MVSELLPSRFYSFLDMSENYAVTFFEGQGLVKDLAIMHHKNAATFSFFRDAVLATQHMIQFFKNDEQLGFYIDCDDPLFHFKFESNTQGFVRTLLIPDILKKIPKKISAIARLHKTAPHFKEPYRSIVQIENMNLQELINDILQRSYQVKARVVISDHTDQSIMVSRLPVATLKSDTSQNNVSVLEPEHYLTKKSEQFNAVFARNLNREAPIIEMFEKIGFVYLRSMEICFHCPCSKEQFVTGLKMLNSEDAEDIFAEGENTLEIVCDYCRKKYYVTRADLGRDFFA